MTSRIVNETPTTRRLGFGIHTGKGAGKTTNLSTSKRPGAPKDYEQQRYENASKCFQDRLPVPLKKKDAGVGTSPEKHIEESKKKPEEKEKEDLKSSTVNYTHMEAMTLQEQNSTMKKEESNPEGSENLDQSDEEYKKRDQQMKEKLIEQDLAQNIYITLIETPTTFMFFTPSTKCLTLKNDNEVKEETFKDENYKAYLDKRKNNKEAFVTKGTQTLTKFKRNQLVTTSLFSEQENDMADQKVNCLNWHIMDSATGEKSKKDDDKILQRKLDRQIKKELKEKLKNSQEMVSVDLSSESMQRSELNESASLMDTKLSSSIHSSRRPKGRSLIKDTQEKSDINERKSSPNSSLVKITSVSSDPSAVKAQGPSVTTTRVHSALNEELPKSIINALKYIERLLSQNKFHFRQIAYKDYPISMEEFEIKKEKKNDPLPALDFGAEPGNEEQDQAALNIKNEIALFIDKSTDPSIKKLFTYSIKGILKENNISSNYIVHSMDWNSNNDDLLVAGYGDPDVESKNPGFLCFWTLKNPLHPERVIQTPRGITSCNFSNKNPYLIVASDYLGEILIYDLRSNSNKPIADSTEVKDKHTDIVWECKWIERPNDKNEIVVSISSDGKVKEWSLKKGLEVTDLMKMKKNTSFSDKSLNPFEKYIKKHKDKGKETSKEAKDIKESLIFREANGLSFDFPNNDTTIYYIALEECTIHRCRISYKDQYTDNYYGHQGAVNKVRCNPYDPNILISCSYDWTVKIWNSKHTFPILNLQSNELIHQINDIEWSRDKSTVFGCVADDGRIEIWDLSKQAIQPIIVFPDDKERQGNSIPRKSIKFSAGGKIVASGTSDGEIDIFRLYNLEHAPISDDEQIKILNDILIQNSDMSH